ncbi:hypothetical protein I5Q34_29995 [Streptomyces sp. AV19]|uniref:hypothetical protein n=1 Tax=Streptomyces sp. AV19 TaxID=2793068 RepID=UPI0018FE9E09|nr:hypothetical protein [Streptomyces sp. AV19]MBH1938441.1 hypothetical protein [Streptomyces sp. AV19]MDG4535089.1 hypothetical protein [Streptomyces sp. AV19]
MGGSIIITKRASLSVACCAVVLATGAVACGTEEKIGAEGKVQKAFDRLGEEKGLAVDISLDASADDIHAALKDGKDGIDRDEAGTLAGLKLTYAFSSDKPLKDNKKDDAAPNFSMSFGRKDGGTLGEIRSLDKKVYLRGDIKAIAALSTPTNAEEREGKRAFEEMLGKADEQPPSLGAFKNVLKGEWVVIDSKEFEKLSKNKKKSGTEDLDKKSQKKINEVLKKTLTENADIKDAGTKNGADHVKVTVPARKAAKELSEALKPFQKQLSAAGKDKKLPKPEDLPDKKATFDIAVKDGKLSAITFDAADLDKEVHARLPVTIGFGAKADKVTAPSGAKELKMDKLMEGLMFLGTGEDPAGMRRA